MKYSNLHIVHVEKPDPQMHGGYPYLVLAGSTNYVAFRTKKGFDAWVARSNIKLELSEEKTSTPFGKVKVYRAYGVIEERLFWSLTEVPDEAKKFKGLSNGSLVDCYYLHTNDGAIIYMPNSNAPEVYKPLPLDQRIEFMRTNG